jgi:hypothetical protein
MVRALVACGARFNAPEIWRSYAILMRAARTFARPTRPTNNSQAGSNLVNPAIATGVRQFKVF